MSAVKLVITPVVGGLVFCGAMLVLIASLGIASSVLSHQGLLFAVSFYGGDGLDTVVNVNNLSKLYHTSRMDMMY